MHSKSYKRLKGIPAGENETPRVKRARKKADKMYPDKKGAKPKGKNTDALNIYEKDLYKKMFM